LTTTAQDLIRTVCAKYCHHLDGTGGEQEIGALLDLFTDDGSVYSPRQSKLYRGRENLREFFRGVHAVSKGRNKHLTSNIVISVSGHTAQAVSDWVYIRHNNEDGTGVWTVTACGRFHDEFISYNGEWRIKSRKITRGNEAPVPSDVT
jgi:ketosteroid isomerase-like protein